MTTRPRVGLTLQPEMAFLDRLDAVIREDVELYEVAPETLWRPEISAPGVVTALTPNAFHDRIAALVRETGRPVVAHGVNLSVGTADRGDAPRLDRWLERVAADHQVFDFGWYSDHLGVTMLGDELMALPLPIPPCVEAARVVGERLARLQRVVAEVALETTAQMFAFGSPLAEPALLRQVLDAPGRHLVLDVHNVWTMGLNFGFDPQEYVAALDLAKVIEIHVSGGSWSDPAWLASRRSLRIDSHDHAVPEPVWALLESVVSRCPNLRAVVLERMEGTVLDEHVPEVRAELRRVQRLLEGWSPDVPAGPPTPEEDLPACADLAALQRATAAALRAPDAAAAMARVCADAGLPLTPDADGVRLAAMIIGRLRYERIVQGSAGAEAWFDADPAGFVREFRRYHAEVPAVGLFPRGEARLFRQWLDGAA